jgi:hypothetical protein
VVLATKFGFRIDAEGRIAGLDSRPAHVPGGRRGLAGAAGDRPDRPAVPALGWTQPCRSRRPWEPRRPWYRRARSVPRPVRGERRHAPPGACRPPDQRAAVRILAVRARPGARDPAHVPGTGRRPRALVSARPRPPDRPGDPGRGTAGSRLPAPAAPLPGRELRLESHAGRTCRGTGRPGSRHACPDSACLAARAGAGHRAHLRH